MGEGDDMRQGTKKSLEPRPFVGWLGVVILLLFIVLLVVAPKYQAKSESRAALNSSLLALESTDQKIRDFAARNLRKNYVAPSKDKYADLMASIHEGDSKAKVLDLVAPFHAKSEMGDGGGGSYSESYRLDDLWVLQCWYSSTKEELIRATLIQNLRHVWVQPPPHFSGVWITYFVNGQKSHEINYRDGIYFGEFKAFYDRGAVVYVQHYTAEGCDGEDTGYFPNGKIMYRAHYKSGKPVGTWTWYNEDGSVRSSQEQNQ